MPWLTIYTVGVVLLAMGSIAWLTWTTPSVHRWHAPDPYDTKGERFSARRMDALFELAVGVLFCILAALVWPITLWIALVMAYRTFLEVA